MTAPDEDHGPRSAGPPSQARDHDAAARLADLEEGGGLALAKLPPGAPDGDLSCLLEAGPVPGLSDWSADTEAAHRGSAPPTPLECLLDEPAAQERLVYSPTGTTHFFAYELESLATLSALGRGPRGYQAAFLRRKREFLAAVLGAGASLELRLSSRPEAEAFTRGRVHVTLIGRVAGEPADRVVELVPEVLRLQRACLPEYAWRAVPADGVAALLAHPESGETLELRRRVEWLDVDTQRPFRPGRTRLGFGPAPPSGGAVAQGGQATLDARVLHVFPFVPAQAPLDRLFELLLTSPDAVCISFRVEPAILEPEEIRFLESQVALCESCAQTGLWGGSDDPASLKPALQVRARGLERALSRIADRLRRSAVVLRVRVASAARVPRTLVHQVGALLSSRGARPSREALAGGYEVAPSECPGWLGWDEQPLPRVPHTPPGAGRLPFLFALDDAAAALQLPPATPRTVLGLAMRQARELAPPHDLPREGHLLGRVRYRDSTQDCLITEADRQQHVYVCGQTGAGKSTLLAGMILADIERGDGVCVIDPHGDLYQDVLRRIPPRRAADLVLIDPTDRDWPVGLNLLDVRSPEERHLAIDAFASLMERILEDQYGLRGLKDFAGPAFWQQVRMNLSLLTHDPARPATLLDFCALFQEEDYWRRWLPLAVAEPQLERWVTNVLPKMDFLKAGSDNGISWGAYIGSKFERFVFFPPLRNMFAQVRSTIDFRQLMDQRRIVLVNLAKGELTETNSRFLGMVVLAKLQAAALGRSDAVREGRRPFYVYVDEFGALATSSFKSLLSEGRKFGISLVLANQYLGQIQDESIREAIFGNVGTLVAFRTGHDDAQRLAREYYPGPAARDFVGLPNWRAYARALVRGQRAPAFALETIPLRAVDDPGLAYELMLRSRKSYSRHRAEVEAPLRAR